MGGIRNARELFLDFAPGAEARIDYLLLAEPVEGFCIQLEPCGLVDRLTVPCEAEPVEVLLDERVETGPDAGVIEVFEAQEERASLAAGDLVGHQGSVGVAEVEPSGGAGGKARQHGVSFKLPS